VLHSIFSLILDTVAGLLAGVLLLRFWMQTVRVRAPMPIGQFVFQLTDWLVRPLRRAIPGVAGFDWATLLAACLVALLATSLDAWVGGYLTVNLVLLLTLQKLLTWIVYGLIALLILGAIFSWVNPQAPLAPFVDALTDPILRPLRRVIPMAGPIDLTPLVALVLLQIALHLVRNMLGLMALG
jgi:YggT family protein